jgi:hypothetical protein
MIRYLTLEEVLDLHRLLLERSGGLDGVRDLNGLDSALAQPQMAFGGQDLYPSLAEKAAALGLPCVQSPICRRQQAGRARGDGDVLGTQRVGVGRGG